MASAGRRIGWHPKSRRIWGTVWSRQTDGPVGGFFCSYLTHLAKKTNPWEVLQGTSWRIIWTSGHCCLKSCSYSASRFLDVGTIWNFDVRKALRSRQDPVEVDKENLKPLNVKKQTWWIGPVRYAWVPRMLWPRMHDCSASSFLGNTCDDRGIHVANSIVRKQIN